jgi:hypothetical protein
MASVQQQQQAASACVLCACIIGSTLVNVKLQNESRAQRFTILLSNASTAAAVALQEDSAQVRILPTGQQQLNSGGGLHQRPRLNSGTAALAVWRCCKLPMRLPQ